MDRTDQGMATMSSADAFELTSFAIIGEPTMNKKRKALECLEGSQDPVGD